jgi:hypothetical protein
MPLALTDDHRDLAASVDALLARRNAIAGNRALLEADIEALPPWWREVADLGWLGLHVPEHLGGAGFSMEESAIVVEGCGRHVAPGPLVPTVVASAVLSAVSQEAALGADIEALVSALADGTVVGAFGLNAQVSLADGVITGHAVVLGGGLADVFVMASDGDLLVVRRDDSVMVEVPKNLDPGRRSARVTFSGTSAVTYPGLANLLRDLSRVVLAAEAVGVASRCTEEATAYAKVREQFGRPIGTFQAVKHHAADMAATTELATSAVWDAARAVGAGSDQRAIASATAATLAAGAVDLCTNLNTQIHGGIAMTWEHDAHLYVRRAAALQALLVPDQAAGEIAAMTASGVTRAAGIELPAESEGFRGAVREVLARLEDLDESGRLGVLIETGYVMPHWPRPFGRGAGPVEQLVIEQEFTAARLKRPSYSITGWVLLTLIQHGTPDQVERWILPALRR